MSTIFFSELQQISGRRQRAAVMRYLKNNGISFMLDADGKPWTTEKRLEDSLDAGRRTGPNWSAIVESAEKRLP
ncbi:MAG: DUF4224 domain-containing protein [Pseudomonadota bacterium]